ALGERYAFPWCALPYAASGSWLTWRVGRPIAVVGRLAFDDLRQRRRHPMRALEVSQETGAVARRKQRLRLTHAGVERFLRGAVGHESLALLDADGSQLIDHRPIALDPRSGRRD